MAHWSKQALSEISQSLAEKGVNIINEPTGRPERFESITLAKLIELCLKGGFVSGDEQMNLSHTNHIPYRRVTQGSGINQQADMSDILSWVSPVFELERNQQSLSFFREGSPFLRSRDRPDLLVYPGSFEIEQHSDPFVGEHVIVSWSGSSSGERRYKKETNANGPIAVENQGEPISPVLGMEVSLRKSCDRLQEQVDLLQEVGSNNIAAILEHSNPCSSGELPTGTTVLKAEDKREFCNSMEQIGNHLLRGKNT